MDEREIKFDREGLLPVVVQDQAGRVLMVAYMNKEALRLTLETGKMHYFSRHRQKIWLKGETSGHYQHLKKLFIDCDGDCLLAVVEQNGAACHTGYYSCFFRSFANGKFVVSEKKIFDPKEVYRT
ncbi:MAG: phosphoribosyl-AMP cyclohydrolase [Candidatus Omnitrophica bacterium]|nr:phosphoribosyl-AMP cyclohydrolase [Candidatus Omnitrophota bacterium]MCM8768505.1 phosphoribosyl-AMP cyclohydrolase [Candidatus Omnitrophota bacterium]